MESVIQLFAILLSIAGYFCNAKRKRIGFIFWFAGNFLWLIVDLLAKIYLQVAALIIYNIFATYAFFNWREYESPN
jgi:nicotinamide riboside transporter PnuC